MGNLVLPLFPTSGVILPHGKMILKANQQPYIQLLEYCIKNEEPFSSLYFDESGLYNIGCACFTGNYEMQGGEITCEVFASQRISLDSVVTIKDGVQTVSNNGKEIQFKMDEPIEDIPYSMFNGNLFLDSQSKTREDIKIEVYDKFRNLANSKNKELCKYFDDLSNADDLDEGVSFFILDSLIGDHSENDNRMRYEFLTKRSENKRLREVRKLFFSD